MRKRHDPCRITVQSTSLLEAAASCLDQNALALTVARTMPPAMDEQALATFVDQHAHITRLLVSTLRRVRGPHMLLDPG